MLRVTRDKKHMGTKAPYATMGFPSPAAPPKAIACTADLPFSRNRETGFVPVAILLQHGNTRVTSPRQTRRPVKVPDRMRSVLQTILRP